MAWKDRKNKKNEEVITKEFNENVKVKLDFDFADSEEEIDEVETNGNDFDLYSDKMLLRLKMSLDRIKKYYSDFRNEMNKYDKITFRSTNNGDTYLYKNKVVLKVTVFARALKIYFALDPKEFDQKYHLIDMKDTKKYENIPLMIRVGSDRSYKYLLEILESFVKKFKLPLKKVATNVDYEKDLISNTQEIIKLLGYDDILLKMATLNTCEAMPNNVAKNAQVLVTNVNKTKGPRVVHEVTIGELSAAFKDKYQITLKLLQDVGLASSDANYLRVIAKGECRCKLSVYANDYDLQALKMIAITGGNIVKYI